MVLAYTRTKFCSVEPGEKGTVVARALVEEPCYAAEVRVVAGVPDMDIISLEGNVGRCFVEDCRKSADLLGEAQGLRIGPGIIKLVNGLVGGGEGCPRMGDLLLECVNAVILNFTVASMKESEGVRDAGAKENPRRNPRLLNSCIAFAPGSPLVAALKEDG